MSKLLPESDLCQTILRPLQHPRHRADTYIGVHLLLVPLILCVLAWSIEHSSLDLAFTQLFVDPVAHTFALRGSLLLDLVGHRAARGLPFAIGGLSLVAGLAGFRFARLRPWSPVLLGIGFSVLLGPLVVNMLKDMTTQHCPSALLNFGGGVDYFADQAGPFWAATVQSVGHCLPSGHAAGGYSLLSLYFAGWAAGRPRWRWSGLAVGIAAGLVFSVVRVVQGAHFASATVWSAAIDWTVCAAVFLPLLCERPSTAVWGSQR